MWATITKPFAWLFVWLYNLTGNYGAALLLFALAVNLVMTPFMAKSKKGMMRQTRLQPKLQELQRRHEGNQQKLNEEMQKLYREEGVNPMSGCLWSLIPFPILIALYSVIRQPFLRMMFVSNEVLEAVKEFCVNNGWYTLPAKTDAYMEIKLANIMHDHFSDVTAYLQSQNLPIDKLVDLDFNLFGINLGEVPWDTMKLIFAGTAVVGIATIGLALIPLISAALSWLSMKVANMANPQTGVETQQQAQMKSMNLMMPLMSLWFCFIMPAAMGIYWSANSIFGMIRDFILTRIYKRKLDLEDAERNAERQAREREMEQRRIETERLRAEGKSEQNANTSKKKIQQNEKQRQAERSAAIAKEERAARREQRGIKEPEKPASQVGNRRYARGRAYVPDRFTNPKGAEEATLAAAAESEGNLSIDESVAEESLFPSTVEETAAEESAVNEQE
ncbi:MAG: membrane protein insertase YidC [Oscillospiraceae bacterium]|nr:membrane protein insertase YidC [Oscillospiraceae bacterium]